MVYAVNKFRHYLLGNRFIFYVDHLALQYLVNKPQVSGRLARWLLLFLEFDFKVIYKPSKIHSVADALSRNEGAEPATGILDQTTDAQLFSMQPDWIHPIIDYLQTDTFPPSMTKEARKCLAYQAIIFQLVEGRLYQQGKDSRLRQVISDSQAQMILQILHKGNAGGHFSQDITVCKVLDAGYWWPTLYKDTYKYCQTYHEYQKTRGLPKSVSTKLITTLPTKPFMKWGLDFVGPVKKTWHTGKRYILVATDYATKWIEVRALRKNFAQETAQFLYESILTRFRCPLHLVSDQGSHFLNGTIQVLTEHFLLRHTTSTTYYPQSNGQAESTNKVIVTMLQKLVNDNRTDWDIQLYTVLFSYRTAYKVATGHSPFELVYGLLSLMPTEYIVPTQRTTINLDFTQHRVLATRTANLDKLDETRLKAQTHQGQAQWNRAQWRQSQGNPHQFHMGDYVLWYPKGANVHVEKLRNKWFGPYRVQYLLPNNTVLLVTVEKFDPDPVIVNINKLKICRCPEEGLPDLSSSDHQTKTQLIEASFQNEDEPIGNIGTHPVIVVSVTQPVPNPKIVPHLDTF